jgi:hypothetical protein
VPDGRDPFEENQLVWGMGMGNHVKYIHSLTQIQPAAIFYCFVFSQQQPRWQQHHGIKPWPD